MNHEHTNHTSADNAVEKIIYSCPMHPEIQQDKPGICPKCGMTLLPQGPGKSSGDHGGHNVNKHEGHSIAMFKNKFWVSLFLSVFVVLYSGILYKFFSFAPPAFPGSSFIPLIFGSVVFFYGGWVFLIGAYREIRAKRPGMMTLIGMAILVAYFYSLYSGLILQGETLFWELTTLITIMLLGHWMEMRAVQGAQGALKELAKLLPDTAEVVRGKDVISISISELIAGDIVMVKPGGKVPADGALIDGNSEINEAMVTGESKAISKTVGDRVIAGTINGDGNLKIKVDKIGEETFLAGVMKLVAEAQNSKSKLQILSDRAAFYLTLIALASGTATFVYWFFTAAGINFALERTVAVLVVACPHALGLAVPLVASISTSMAAKNGLLIKQRASLEIARKIQVVLFDKTGTLTKGEYGVDEILPSSFSTKEEVLRLASAVDAGSEHPIAKAIIGEAKKQKLPIASAKNFQRIPGKGTKAIVDGKEVFVGSETLVKEMKFTIEKGLRDTIDRLEKQGKTIIFIISGKQFLGSIALADIIREESRQAIQSLRALGVKVAMVTGDSQDVAEWVAKELHIDEYFAKVLPQEKAEKVKLLQKKGLKVAMVGDGVNDAPALTQADLGIAIGAGTNVAVESAGIILVKNDPRDIPKIIRLSKLTYSKMIQNLFWATGYNVIAIPLSAGVLAFKGIFLQPALAAAFMSLSTVIVALNAVLLKRKKLF